MKSVLLFLALTATALPQATTVLFSADGTGPAYAVGPFPSNSLAVPDSTQATGLRVNLPSSDDSCSAQPEAVCSYSAMLNQLDGFSVNPRLMVCFSGPVDQTTLSSGLSILPITGKKVGAAIGVDRLVYDTATNCAYAKPAHPLLQRSLYLLEATNSITAGGQSVQADSRFTACKSSGSGYCAQLSAALGNASQPNVVAASLFTTMSVTAWLQGAQSVASNFLPVNIPAGIPSTLALSQLSKLTYNASQSGLGPQSIPLSALNGVGSVSFGMFLSPQYLNQSGQAAGTITTSPLAPTGVAIVSYHVFLPQTHGKAKIPVVIYAHGSGDTQFGAPTYLASTLAQNGIATLAFELTGHGYGAGSYVTATLKSGGAINELTPGRGIVMAAGQPIAAESGCVVPGPIGVRDCVRQSAVDIFGLVSLIRNTGGLGLNLDPNDIFVLGQSLGSLVSSASLPIEPNLKAGILNADGGTSVDIARLSPSARPLAEAFLLSVGNPLLLNVAAGLAPPDPTFQDAVNDNFVFSGLAPQTYSVPYAPNLQAAFEAADWLGMLADPVSFGPYIDGAPLPGVPHKPELFQFGISDLEVPNPTETAGVIAANTQNSTWILNFPAVVNLQPQLATLQDPAVPGFPILPHRLLSNPTIFQPGNAAELSLALAEQQQVAAFVASDGKKIADPNQFVTAPFTPGEQLFVTSPLPTLLNYLASQQ